MTQNIHNNCKIVILRAVKMLTFTLVLRLERTILIATKRLRYIVHGQFVCSLASWSIFEEINFAPDPCLNPPSRYHPGSSFLL